MFSSDFATDAEEMIRLGRGLDEVSFVLGQATHFVQDLNQPPRRVGRDPRRAPREVEDQMLYRSWQKDHGTAASCSSRITPASAYSIAEKSSQHARALFFDREIERVTDSAWDQAVNDTANFWQSVFRRALGPERAWQLSRHSASGRRGWEWVAMLTVLVDFD